MELNWKLILSDSDSHHVRLMQSILDAEGLQTSMIDHSDSALPTTSESELYVLEEEFEKATAVLAANQ
jgi:hypothetical protein